ncbi:winged helix-turn-helix transcriptional regulator [Actinacidiphila guanduensis]|jgi:DNA-binding HxlR family transcriptional regulator|uniref:Transcriptional regulator, HxlR family n=1 Tax=Actinacidiphila guanduensis TaxID=310781 RepID=A0A1H0ISM0_9ACTN|nr:helix-turn-helix domain-containing protein [Actinacidiphila guanduensis]SDO34466.1 transcriptional regulator, HxlR family [Actinacidiphila guanduensis]
MKVSATVKGCPERAVLEHLTSTWGVLVLGELACGTRRFSELRRAIDGVSEKMLTQTLRVLERDGFVRREAYPVIPPRVDYALTALGTEAAARVRALSDWTAEHVVEVTAAQRAYDEAS